MNCLNSAESRRRDLDLFLEFCATSSREMSQGPKVPFYSCFEVKEARTWAGPTQRGNEEREKKAMVWSEKVRYSFAIGSGLFNILPTSLDPWLTRFHRSAEFLFVSRIFVCVNRGTSGYVLYRPSIFMWTGTPLCCGEECQILRLDPIFLGLPPREKFLLHSSRSGLLAPGIIKLLGFLATRWSDPSFVPFWVPEKPTDPATTGKHLRVCSFFATLAGINSSIGRTKFPLLIE